MAGNGPSGLMHAQILEERQKCPRSPTKRQYPTLGSAQDAATWRTRETGINISAYACPDCGYFHLSRTSRLDRVLPSTDGRIVTTSMARNEQRLATQPPVERVDMSEVMAMETPIVAGNSAARERLLAEFLGDRQTVTVPEVMEALQIPRYGANITLKALGWHGRRGTPEWLPPGVDFPGPARARDKGRTRNRKVTGRGEDLRKRRLKQLRAYLKDRDGVTTVEIMAELEAGKDMVKSLMHELGWQPGWGANARWTPSASADVVQLPQQTPLQELMASHTTERKLRAVEPIDTEPEEAAAEVVTAAGVPVPASTIAVPITELGWRDIPDIEAVKMKLIASMIDELAPYGIEVRIQIRERR